MIGPTAAELAQAVAAERPAVHLGWVPPCPHQSLLGLPCVRAARHDLPHALEVAGVPPGTSEMPSDRGR